MSVAKDIFVPEDYQVKLKSWDKDKRRWEKKNSEQGANESKKTSKGSPVGCILTHWKNLVGYGGTETEMELVKLCTQWWPLYRLDEMAGKWYTGL